MYTKNSKRIETVGLDEIPDLVTLDEIRADVKQRLLAQNVTELFPVQQAVYGLFVSGRELIVK